ncbi:MAG: hypothetical protein ACI30N_01455 [Muribaculaceae bacterium]
MRYAIPIAVACLLLASCRTTRKAEREVSRVEVDSSATVTSAAAVEAVAEEIRIDSVVLRRDTAGTVTVSARGIRERRLGRRAARTLVARDTVSRRAAAERRSEARAEPKLPAFPTETIVFLSVCLILIVILKWKLK